MKIKICGITNVEDALFAEKLGVDFIGLNFASVSKRQIDIETGKKIINAIKTVIPVGIFVNESTEEIKRVVQELQLKMIQLYSERDIHEKDVKMIQAYRVESDLQAINTKSDFVLFDTFESSYYGGTGKTFDWNQLPKDLSKVFLAGGINQSNIKKACSYHPYAIDICSGVEISPGIKDHQKMTAIMQEFKDAQE